jgi:transcriptional regulator GlxA family with amidase domain
MAAVATSARKAERRPEIHDITRWMERSTPRLVGSTEMADLLGCTRQHVNRLAASGLLPVAAVVGAKGQRLYDPARVLRALTPEG